MKRLVAVTFLLAESTSWAWRPNWEDENNALAEKDEIPKRGRELRLAQRTPRRRVQRIDQIFRRDATGFALGFGGAFP